MTSADSTSYTHITPEIHGTSQVWNAHRIVAAYVVVAMALLFFLEGCGSARVSIGSSSVASGKFHGIPYRAWITDDMTCLGYASNDYFCESQAPLLSPNYAAQIEMEHGVLIALTANDVHFISFTTSNNATVEVGTEAATAVPAWRYVVQSAVPSIVSYRTLDSSGQILGSHLCPIATLGSGVCAAGPSP